MSTPTIALTRAQASEVDHLLGRCDSPAAAWLALGRKFDGDIDRWIAWLRWLDEDAYRAN